MYAGKIAELGEIEEIIESSLHPYTRLLMNSLLPLEAWIKTKRLRGVAGKPPDLRFPPTGCRFHPRCPQCMDICKSTEPPTIEMKNEHLVSCWLYREEK